MSVQASALRCTYTGDLGETRDVPFTDIRRGVDGSDVRILEERRADGIDDKLFGCLDVRGGVLELVAGVAHGDRDDWRLVRDLGPPLWSISPRYTRIHSPC